MIEDIIKRQEELMLEVPHTVRSDALVKMAAGVKVIDVLLRFLGSTGHKPWRPVPLPLVVQDQLLEDLKNRVGVLAYVHHTTAGADREFSDLEHYSRQMVSALGVIEEMIEYLNSLADGSSRQRRLEELVDVFFFYLEQVILGEFSWDEVEKEYVRKWDVNMERYRRAKEGDYEWNHRGKGSL